MDFQMLTETNALVLETWREHLRLGLLTALTALPGYRAPSPLLTDLVRHAAFGASRDVVRCELMWLRDVGLAQVRSVEGGILIAELSERGLDVVNGFAVAPGVARPGDA